MRELESAMEGAGEFGPAQFENLEEVERFLRNRYQGEDAHGGRHYRVHTLATSGEVGERCLTFRIDLGDERFAHHRRLLDLMVDKLRGHGFEVDELHQDVSQESEFEHRVWLMIYE